MSSHTFAIHSFFKTDAIRNLGFFITRTRIQFKTIPPLLLVRQIPHIGNKHVLYEPPNLTQQEIPDDLRLTLGVSHFSLDDVIHLSIQRTNEDPIRVNTLEDLEKCTPSHAGKERFSSRIVIGWAFRERLFCRHRHKKARARAR